MNIIEAIQHAENGKLIRNGILKRIDRVLKYMGRGVFYEYELIDGYTVYKYEVREFNMGHILTIFSSFPVIGGHR